MTAQEIKKQIKPSTIDGGVVRNGDSVPFALVNESPYDFEFYTKSCGCVGTISLSPRGITGNVKADYHKSGLFLYVVDGQYCQKIEKPTGDQYFNVNTNTVLSDPKEISEPVNAYIFSQSIQVYFKDGKNQYAISPDGEQVKGEQLSITVPIKFWVLEK
ncbi:MAG TPA: hypothetical protein VGK47_06305 [Nitrososphaeraceae archaeon]